MHVNRRRGEVLACLNGKDYRLCLTLASLAELEDAYATEDLSQLVDRFSNFSLSSKDMIRIIGAGLRGGGEKIEDELVAHMQADGAASYVKIVSDLLVATFGTPEEEKKNP